MFMGFMEAFSNAFNFSPLYELGTFGISVPLLDVLLTFRASRSLVVKM